MLPAVLHTHIRAVAPTTNFASTRVVQQTPHRHSFGAAQVPAPGKLVTSRLWVIRQIIPPFRRWPQYAYTATVADRNTLAVVSFSENRSQADMNKFNTDLHTGVQGASCR